MGQVTPGILVFFQIPQVPYEFLMKLAIVGVILVATWIVTEILGRLVSKALGKLNPSVVRQVRRIVTWLIWLIGILIALDHLGLELTILLVFVTLAGIAILIAFRDMLSNVTSHEAITIYGLFKIGDWIQVGQHFGRVVDINWMDTVLMTPDNEMVYIPNSKLAKSIVTNRTASGETRISVPLTVDDTVDLSEVEGILLEIGSELGEELAPDSKPEVRVTNVSSHSIEVALLLKIINPAKGNLIASEVRKRAKTRLDTAPRKNSQ